VKLAQANWSLGPDANFVVGAVDAFGVVVVVVV